MFSLIWRFMPGPGWLRFIVVLAAAAALVYLLMLYVYPFAAQFFAEDVSTVG